MLPEGNHPMSNSLLSYFDNAAPPLAWRFVNIGDSHTGAVESVELRPSLDSEREPVLGADGEPVLIPVFTVSDTTTGELRSLYGKPAVMSALVTGLKAAKIGVEDFQAAEGKYTVEVTLSSLGTPSRAGYSAPQRFTVKVTTI